MTEQLKVSTIPLHAQTTFQSHGVVDFDIDCPEEENPNTIPK
jgi:hypothetical protein